MSHSAGYENVMRDRYYGMDNKKEVAFRKSLAYANGDLAYIRDVVLYGEDELRVIALDPYRFRLILSNGARVHTDEVTFLRRDTNHI